MKRWRLRVCMPRRENLQTRAGRHAQRFTRFLIFCGGVRTEPQYFDGVKTLAYDRQPPVVVQVRSTRDAPERLLARATAFAAQNPGLYDEVWCVFDVDHFEREGGKVSAAAVAATRAGVGLAVSNPCFEVWLVLHHADCGTAFAHCDAAADRLRKHLPAYDKTKLRFADFAECIPDAIRRAKKLDPTGMDHKMNPSTGVWALVEKLMEQEQ